METTSRSAGSFTLDPALVRKLLVDFLHDESGNAGFSKAVVGLSGGVDSSVVAYLSAEAFGRDNVVAVILPHRLSSPQSRVDAEQVASGLGIRAEVVDITPMVDAYLERWKVNDRVRAGNVMARARMIVLYDISQRERALVIGTSNKTEMLLGYGTAFGDLACALNPIGDLYKSQVWHLARAIGVPEAIVAKKPSADLWEGQTDEGDFGFTYENVDRLLYFMVDERRNDQELKELGFADQFVRRVKDMILKSQFKRRPPVIAKVSHRTVNVDFRYARDWGI